MANTTDMVIVCFGENEVIRKISEQTRIDFREISDGDKAGGSHISPITVYAASYRSLGKDRINELIDVFKNADFLFPELVSLTIDDDNDVFNGVIVRERMR